MIQGIRSLEEWCHENNRDDLLNEWDMEKNILLGFSKQPSEVKYNASLNVEWKCQKGHEWRSCIVARTVFGLTCPICNPEKSVLPIGTKYGCLTIIGGFEKYGKEDCREKNPCLEQGKAVFFVDSSADSVDFYDRCEGYKKRKYYQCQCKCGLVQFMDEFDFLKKKHRYCTDIANHNLIYQSADSVTMTECGLKSKQREKLLASYKRVFVKNYDIDFTHTFHESLEVLECIDEHYEELTSWSDKRKKGGGTYTVYKLYRCRCYLCGKEIEVKCSQFFISPPTDYGYTAYNGYYSGVYCNCHKTSSFQWIVNKILKENDISYRVEVSFPNLYGAGNTNLLRYDFSILNEDGTIKCLIECQGEQHYKPVDKFGGEIQFELQKKNDNLKRVYAKENNIPLYEISYKNKKYEKVKEFLKLKGII